jgi:3-methylcrotonyl-CoA carboxylase alpha subunit
MATRTLTLVDLRSDREHEIEIGDDSRVRVDNRYFHVQRDRDGTVRIDGEKTPEAPETTKTAWTAASADVRWVFLDGRVYELGAAPPERMLRRPKTGHHGSLTAPMPATVRRVLVNAGDVVQTGDSLIVLEAMKMELPVRAASPGTIRAVLCREGELVQPGARLIDMVGMDEQ